MRGVSKATSGTAIAMSSSRFARIARLLVARALALDPDRQTPSGVEEVPRRLPPGGRLDRIVSEPLRSISDRARPRLNLMPFCFTPIIDCAAWSEQAEAAAFEGCTTVRRHRRRKTELHRLLPLDGPQYQACSGPFDISIWGALGKLVYVFTHSLPRSWRRSSSRAHRRARQPQAVSSG